MDNRNLKTLVEGFDEKLSRIPSGLQKDIASIRLRIRIYRRYQLDKAAELLENYINDWLKLMVSDQGKGRAEMVAAIQSESGMIQPPKIGQNGQQNPNVVIVNGSGPKPVKTERPKVWERLNQGLK